MAPSLFAVTQGWSHFCFYLTITGLFQYCYLTFFFLWLSPQHVKVPGPGVKTALQLQPGPQLQQHQLLHPWDTWCCYLILMSQLILSLYNQIPDFYLQWNNAQLLEWFSLTTDLPCEIHQTFTSLAASALGIFSFLSFVFFRAAPAA